MQTIYTFSYTPAIATGTNTIGVNWRMAYQQPIMLYKGTANTIKIVVFATNQRVVNLTGYQIQVQIVDKETEEHYVTRTAIVTSPTSGVGTITFTEAELRNLENRFYHIIARLVLPSDGSSVTTSEILYLDDNYGAFLPIQIENAWNYQPTIISTENGAQVINFRSIGETPDSYTGHAGKLLKVNNAENAIEFSNLTTSNTTISSNTANLTFTFGTQLISLLDNSTDLIHNEGDGGFLQFNDNTHSTDGPRFEIWYGNANAIPYDPPGQHSLDIRAAANSYVELASYDLNSFIGIDDQGPFIQTKWQSDPTKAWRFLGDGELRLPTIGSRITSEDSRLQITMTWNDIRFIRTDLDGSTLHQTIFDTNGDVYTDGNLLPGSFTPDPTPLHSLGSNTHPWKDLYLDNLTISNTTISPTNGNLFVDGNFVPTADNTFDLGSPTNQWKHLYVANGSIYIGNIKLTNEAGKLAITTVINPGEENEAPDPEDSNAGDSVTSKLTNGEHTFELMNDGSLKLDGSSFTGSGSSGVVERSISFPNGESGDTRGTIALTPDGTTYICTADWQDAAIGLQGTFTAITVELYNIVQSGGIYNSAILSIADEPEIYNILRYGSWSEGQFTIDAGATWGGVKNVTSTGYNDQAGLMYIQWMVSPGDPQEIPLGTSVTVVYTGGGTQTPIWKKLVDLVSGGEGSGVGAIEWRSEGDLTIETLRPQGYTGDCDLNLYAADDVFITANGDEVSIQANTNVTIESNGGNHAWTFAQNGSLQLPSLNNTGYQNGYGLNGPTLRLGGENDPNDQVIITGPEPDSNSASAQRLVIQGQRGYGDWNQPVAGEGGDVYIWGGVGGEGSDGGNYYGGSGGDIKIRGGQGQNNAGGYVKIEGGSAADFNGGSNTGGYIEISGGDATGGGNGNGGDVNIRGGRKQGTGNNGQVYIRTGSNSEHEFVFNNGGGLDLPTNGGIGFNYGYIDQDTTFDNNAMRISGGDQVGIYSNEDSKRWLFKADGTLELPVGGDIVDSSGNSVLSAGADTNVWVQTFASDTVGDNVTAATSVEYDPDGNVIALFSHDDTNDSERYISVAKFDTSGGKLWQQRFAAGQYSDGWGLAADSTAIYVAGELEGAGSPAAYQVSSLMKLNTANGNVIWMKSFDFGELSYNQVVDVASDGNPVMVGHAYSGGQAFLTTTKLDKDTGNIIWSRKLDGQNGEYAYGMAVGPAGEIVVIGYMDNVGILNAAASLYSDPVSNANWTQNTGLTAGALTAAVTFTDGVSSFTSIVDGSGNRNPDDVIGTFNGTGFGGTSPADDMTVKVGTVLPGDNSDRMLVVKYDSAGFIQWQKAIQYDAGFDCSGVDADIDADGNIYICGQYWKDNGAGGTTTAMSLLKMDGNGAKQWSRRTVGDCQDLATSVVVGPDNCLYLSGVTGSTGGSDYSFVIAKFTPLGSVVWQRLLDNTTTWTFGSSWFGNGGGSNIAVKNGYVAVSGIYGDPGPNPETAFIAQISNAGSLFTVGDWDFKGASFSGVLDNTASDLTVTAAGKTDSDNAINITIASQTPATDASNFLVPTKYVLSTPIGDLTVLNNILRGTGDNSGGSGLFLAPGPNLNDMYFKIRGGDNPTHLHFDTGNNEYYDQYWGDDNKYLKLGANGIVTIQAYTPMLGGETWTFSTDRTTTIPGALIQGTVASTYTSTPLPLNVKFATNKLADGSYTLADGVEGQIMYLVPQTGVTPANVSVDVANFRTGGFASTNGLLYPFRIFNDANASYYDSRAFCTLIFTDGAWQQQGGSWD